MPRACGGRRRCGCKAWGRGVAGSLWGAPRGKWGQKVGLTQGQHAGARGNWRAPHPDPRPQSGGSSGYNAGARRTVPGGRPWLHLCPGGHPRPTPQTIGRKGRGVGASTHPQAQTPSHAPETTADARSRLV